MISGVPGLFSLLGGLLPGQVFRNQSGALDKPGRGAQSCESRLISLQLLTPLITNLDLYIYIYMCMYMYMCIYIYMYPCTCMFACLSARLSVFFCLKEALAVNMHSCTSENEARPMVHGHPLQSLSRRRSVRRFQKDKD